MVYILTVITLWNWGGVDTEIEGVYLSYEGAKRQMDLLKEQYKQQAERNEILDQPTNYKYSYIISNFYTRE